MVLNPKQSYQHTLKEISVNRESPCELVRELVSNAYDADAQNIYIFPLLQKEGLIFFDDGLGLSMEKLQEEQDSPYLAFFSIGLNMKTKGEKIGYKCQGSKLCFASGRFALITRCAGEDCWRTKIIENPQETLNADYDITPNQEFNPENFLESFFVNPDHRSLNIINFLNRRFFDNRFKTGTMILVEQFQSSNEFEKYFSTNLPEKSYLYNYIRFNTAHGDIRLIKKEQGFSPVRISEVKSNFLEKKCTLKLWITKPRKIQQLGLLDTDQEPELEIVPKGWFYLPKGDPQAQSPLEVHQLRKGRFSSRHAMCFDFKGEVYTLIFAVDGKRRALDNYEALGRQKDSRCGIPLSSQRGVFLSSHGVKICSYDKLWDDELLAEKFQILKDGTEHFVFFIDGSFELITNRNSLAEQSIQLLKNPAFIKNIRDFLDEIIVKDDGLVRKLIQRLNREITEHREEYTQEDHDQLKISIQNERERFCITSIDVLSDKWFVEPLQGEEHFVGALYTLFSHLVPSKHSLAEYWKRPLTFKGFGIDAVGINQEDKEFESENLIFIEYKNIFSIDDEFNHPLFITNRIICWDFDTDNIEEIKGSIFTDSYGYIGEIKEIIVVNTIQVGLKIGNIRKKDRNRSHGNTVIVLSLKRILKQTFSTEWRPKLSSSINQNSRKRRRK